MLVCSSIDELTKIYVSVDRVISLAQVKKADVDRMMLLLHFFISTLREKVGLCTPYPSRNNTGSRAKVSQLWALFDSKNASKHLAMDVTSSWSD